MRAWLARTIKPGDPPPPSGESYDWVVDGHGHFRDPREPDLDPAALQMLERRETEE